jgi:ABC-type transport system involved in multi-copper enzyme maturation permease subunit
VSWREHLAKFDAFQKGRIFKIIASIVVVVLVAAAGIAYVVSTNRPVEVPELVSPEAAPNLTPEQKNAIDATRRVMEAVLAGRQETTSVLVGLGVGLVLALAVVWLGLGLTYLVLIVLGLAPALLLGLVFKLPSPAWLLGGVVMLTAAFTAFMRALRVLYGGPFRVMAIAKNVLDEATRLKISLVFIVVLIVGLALLPLTIDASSQLRYRVQTFLSFAMGGSFWTIATLVVLFSVASVSFEQRDRVIWQTMTKPVAAWQYVLGKWLGVAGLAAILLAVSGSGIYLFTEHLRSQPADGERPDQAYMTDSGDLSKDRRILETQILSARETKQPEPLEFDPVALAKSVEQIAQSEIDDKSKSLQGGQQAMFEGSRSARYAAIERELCRAYQQQYLSIEPGQSEIYRFTGLQAARDSNQLLILRYKVDTGNNAPNEQYKVTFEFRDGDIVTKEVVLGQFQILELLPSAVDKDGALVFSIINGDPVRGIINPKTFSFPPGGLEISYAVSTFAANFARVLFVLWVKLAFLAMLGIFAATFLSFPVACLVAFGAFLAAEGSPFLRSALDSFATTSTDGKEIYYIRTVMAAISQGVSWLFSTYGDLNPSNRAVEGILMSWREVGMGILVLTAWIGALFMAATAIFRKRELATYSGH